MYWPLTGAFMNVSAVTLRLLLIITAYMDDLLHEDTNIFPVNNKDYLLVPNYRIIEFLSSHGISRTVTDFLFCPELSNYRISITRNITDCHGFSFLLFLSRIFETCPWTHWSQGGNYRIFVFRDSPWFPVWLKINSLIRKFVTKIIPWYSVILRVTIRKFENSLIRDRERLFRDTPRFSVWLKRNNSQIRKFVTRKIITCEKPPVMHY